MKIGILTVSDTCSLGDAEDKSGANLHRLIEDGIIENGTVELYAVVPDEIEMIKAKLLEWVDVKSLDLILTTGGTGCSSRDVTPEATEAVLEKRLPGMVTAMITKSLQITSMAMLSRPACGIRGKTLIVNLPGSQKGSQWELLSENEKLPGKLYPKSCQNPELPWKSEECLEIVQPVIGHAIDLIQDRKQGIEEAHQQIQSLKRDSKTESHHSTTELQHVPHLIIESHRQHHSHHHTSSPGGQHPGSSSHHDYHQGSGLDHSGNHHHHGDNHHHRHHQRNLQESSMGCKSVTSSVDEGHIARRPRKSPYPVISVEDAVNTVMSEIYICDKETINYIDGLHRILADDVFAAEPLPPFPASVKDGYAVLDTGLALDVNSQTNTGRAWGTRRQQLSTSTQLLTVRSLHSARHHSSDGAGPRSVVGDSTAGAMPSREVTSGWCMRISTGAALPPGADAVVQVEDTALLRETEDGKEELEVNILVQPFPGQDIRSIGSDIEKDEKILSTGTKLGPSEIGLLATVGVTKIKCYQLPKVGVMSTGNELVEPEEPLQPGKIRDSNRAMLLSALREQNFYPIDLGIAKDSAKLLLRQITTALEKVDVIVASGGVSMGERDLIKDVLTTDLGAKIHFGRVFMKPGKPTTFATMSYNGKKKLFFGLPGNPVSAIVTCHLYVVPALRIMSAELNPMKTKIKAKLNNEIQLDPRPEYHRCILSWNTEDGLPLAESTGNQISSRLLSMRAANAILLLPAYSEDRRLVKKGEMVDCLVIGNV